MENSFVDGSSEFSLFEAARATSAAPTYFKSITIQERKLVDGGLVANNPIELAYFEARKLFPGDNIKVIVSIGTGSPTNDYHYFSRWIGLPSILRWGQLLLNIATD